MLHWVKSYVNQYFGFWPLRLLFLPSKQLYFHRSLQDIFNVCFDTGFVIYGLAETAWKNSEIPDVIIVRARKK